MNNTENKLKRNEIASKFYGYHSKNHIQESKETLDYLNILEEFLNNYEYNHDDDFIMGGRKKFIYNEILDILNGNQKENNPLYFILGSLEEFISNPNTVTFEDLDQSQSIDGKDLKELRDKNDRYSNKGFICLEEKAYIDNIIQGIRLYINNNLN